MNHLQITQKIAFHEEMKEKHESKIKELKYLPVLNSNGDIVPYADLDQNMYLSNGDECTTYNCFLI